MSLACLDFFLNANYYILISYWSFTASNYQRVIDHKHNKDEMINLCSHMCQWESTTIEIYTAVSDGRTQMSALNKWRLHLDILRLSSSWFKKKSPVPCHHSNSPKQKLPIPRLRWHMQHIQQVSVSLPVWNASTGMRMSPGEKHLIVPPLWATRLAKRSKIWRSFRATIGPHKPPESRRNISK